MPTYYRKDPNAELDWAVDWGSKWLDDGDSITDVDWTVPDGLTQPKPATESGGTAVIWLGGGEAGRSYPVSCRITTAQGRIDERTFVIIVEQR
jgi:hypothetical protein